MAEPLSLAEREFRLVMEYYRSDFDRAKLQTPVATRVLPSGQISYL
jgi:hypothetical protein